MWTSSKSSLQYTQGGDRRHYRQNWWKGCDISKGNHYFHSNDAPNLWENATLFTAAFNNLSRELEGGTDALEETRWKDKLVKYLLIYDQESQKFFPAHGQMDDVMDLETVEDFEQYDQNVVAPLLTFYNYLPEWTPGLMDLLKIICSKQLRGPGTLEGIGLDNDDQITKGRSEAMINHSIWLSNNSNKEGEVIKVGDAHIDDLDGVDFTAPNLNVISKNQYYLYQDETETSSLRNTGG